MEVLISIAAVFLAFFIIAKLFRPLLLALEAAVDRWLIWKQIRDNQRR